MIVKLAAVAAAYVIFDATDSAIVNLITKGGSIGILAFVVIAFVRGWIVPGVAHARVTAECSRAMEMVYKQADIAQRAMEVAERTTRK